MAPGPQPNGVVAGDGWWQGWCCLLGLATSEHPRLRLLCSLALGHTQGDLRLVCNGGWVIQGRPGQGLRGPGEVLTQPLTPFAEQLTC